MRYPLLWKELRESRWALAAGVFWILGPIEFWMQWAQRPRPLLAKIILAPSAMFAPGLCMLLLGVSRFAYERHTGSWDFLLTRPVSLRRAIAVKWGVAWLLGAILMAASSGVSWFPITQLETRLGGVGLVHWMCFHVGGAVLFISVMLFLDTFNWGNRLGTRAAASAVFIVLFMWLMHHDLSAYWWCTFLYLGLASGLAGMAMGAGPYVARESLLSQSGAGRQVGRRVRSATRAWLWLQWRQSRMVAILTLLPAPLFLLVLLVPPFLYSGTVDQGWETAQGLLPVIGRVMPGILCVSGGLLGCLLAVTESQGRAESFRVTLPISRQRAVTVKVAFCTAIAACMLLPFLLWHVVRTSLGVGTLDMGDLSRYLVAGAGTAAICVFMLCATSLVIAFHWLLAVIVAPAGMGICVWFTNWRMYGTRAPSAAIVAICCSVVLLCCQAMVLHDSRREIE